MKKLLKPGLIIPYFFGVLVFQGLFGWIAKFYLKPECLCNKACDHPIDTQLMDGGDCRWFCWQYVQDAAHSYYNIDGYFHSFFWVDFFFPLLYTLLMSSIIRLCWEWPYKKVMMIAVLVGMLLDYTENFSFAIYLKTDISWLSHLTAIATTLKTCVFIANILLCLFVAGWRLGKVKA